MKIDYLKEGAEDCPMVRLYDFVSAEVTKLTEAFQELASRRLKRLNIDEVVPIESTDGTELILSVGDRDRGVVQTGAGVFDVVLTAAGWRQAAELAEPLSKPTCGYQWLTPQAGRINLLLSRTGDW